LITKLHNGYRYTAGRPLNVLVIRQTAETVRLTSYPAAHILI